MATYQIQPFRLNSLAVRGLLMEHHCKAFVKILNTLSQIEIKAYIHFSHHKSMET